MDNALTFLTPHHPLGLLMARHIVDNVNERRYTDGNHLTDHDPLNITGPHAIRNELIQSHQLTYSNVRCFKAFNFTTNKFIDTLANNATGEDRTVLAKNDPIPGDDTHTKMNNCKHCNNYPSLFYQRQTYCDQPGPTEGCHGHNYTYFQDENTWKHMRTMNEEWEGNHPENHLYKQERLEEERKALHDVFLAHNISVGANPNEMPITYPEDNWLQI